MLYCREIAVMTTRVEKGANIFFVHCKKKWKSNFSFLRPFLIRLQLLIIFFFCMVLTCPVPKRRQTARGLDDLVVPDRFIPQRQSLNQRAWARLPDLQPTGPVVHMLTGSYRTRLTLTLSWICYRPRLSPLIWWGNKRKPLFFLFIYFSLQCFIFTFDLIFRFASHREVRGRCELQSSSTEPLLAEQVCLHSRVLSGEMWKVTHKIVKLLCLTVGP